MIIMSLGKVGAYVSYLILLRWIKSETVDTMGVCRFLRLRGVSRGGAQGARAPPSDIGNR